MKTQTWIVGRNRHTKEWAEGGALEEYPTEHWEVFHVEAEDRQQAHGKARGLRERARRARKAREKRQAKKEQAE